MVKVIILEDGKIGIGGKTIASWRFADDTTVALVQEEQELEAIVKSHDKTCTKNKIKIRFY